MKEHPIPFSAPMVRAILGGAKTQTRRVIKPQPEYAQRNGRLLRLEDIDPALWPAAIKRLLLDCPHGQPGDRLWVRESLRRTVQLSLACYAEDNSAVMRDGEWAEWEWQRPTLPSIHMPRWASRLTLEIESVRAERLWDISEADARAEGCETRMEWMPIPGEAVWEPDYEVTARDDFKQLWDSINAKRGLGWDVNPWVWVITFRKLEV